MVSRGRACRAAVAPASAVAELTVVRRICRYLSMRAAFRWLPYCYLALALACAIPVAVVLRSVVSAYQTHDEDVLSPWQLIPLLTFVSLALVFVLAFAANAVLLLRRRRRETSLVLGGLACLAFPFGTALGAVSIFLLTRDEIRTQYAYRRCTEPLRLSRWLLPASAFPPPCSQRARLRGR